MLELRDDIIAGGKSERMGRGKALLDYHGKPFVQHIAEKLQGVFKKVIIISDKGEQHKFLRLPIYEDIYKECGPLGGIHSAFINTDTKNIFVTSVDLPLIETNMIQFLLDQISDADVILFSTDDRVQQLFGLYGQTCMETLPNHIQRNQYCVRGLIEQLNSKMLPAETYLGINRINSLANINTTTDYIEIYNHFA